MELKRLFDFLVALMGLVLLSPVFLIVSVANKLSGNDVFFIHRRMGEGMKLFPFLKFATMVKDAHLVGGTVTHRDDPRVTKIGSVLRKTKLNEIPQLVNVLKGEMSLAGPRPLPSSEVRMYPPGAARKIYSIRPGITGLASLYFYNEEKLLSRSREVAEDTYRAKIVPRKAELELWYVENRSFSLDFKIIIATILVICMPSHVLLSFVGRRLGDSEIRQKIRRVMEMQQEAAVDAD